MIDVETLGSAISRCDAEGTVLAAYLIGSMTTGEFSRLFGASDIDILLVVNESLQLQDEQTLKRKLRASFARCSQDAGGIHFGLRCRSELELHDFVRYLGVQGFHVSMARSIPILGRSIRPLPAFPRYPASGDEVACAYVEALWAQVRLLATRSPTARCYGICKTILMFVNLMLVAEGIFEPTHTTRVRAWFSMSGVEHQPLVSLALAVKTGASVSGLEKNYAAFEMCAVRMRTQLKAKIAALPIISDAVGIGGHFWFDANELPQSVTSRNALIAIAEILIGMLCGSLVAQFIDDPKSAAQYPKMLSELREIATENWNTEPLQTISRINALRFRYSRVSHRDWGTW